VSCVGCKDLIPPLFRDVFHCHGMTVALRLETSVPHPCKPSSMELLTGPLVLEPEVTEIEGYWVHVAVARDERSAEPFRCEVSLYRREPDSQLVRPGRMPAG
jgi:hypothetical protein